MRDKNNVYREEEGKKAKDAHLVHKLGQQFAINIVAERPVLSHVLQPGSDRAIITLRKHPRPHFFPQPLHPFNICADDAGLFERDEGRVVPREGGEEARTVGFRPRFFELPDEGFGGGGCWSWSCGCGCCCCWWWE